MVNGEMIALCVVGGVAVVGLIIAVVIRPRPTPHDTPGQRLLAHSRDRNDYRMFVGVPAPRPVEWAEVSRVSESSIGLRDAQVVQLSEVTSYFVAYPSGMLLDHRGPDNLPMPAWVRLLQPAGIQEQDELTAADLRQGQSLVRVTFGPSTAQPSSRDRYSTTLTNVSPRRVRVLKFGAYSSSGGTFVLNTVMGRFATAAEFQEWYAPAVDWIDPGQSVTDPNNWGSPPVLWAYYCEDDNGWDFVTGALLR